MKHLFLFSIILFVFSCHSPQSPETIEIPEEIKEYLSQYEPYEMTFDGSVYNNTDKQILKNLVKAARYLDTIYWLQTSEYGLEIRDSLYNAEPGPLRDALLTLVNRNGGTFELLNDYEAFYGDQEYYGGEELYPRGMSVAQFDAYVEKLPAEERAEFMYPYTVIREDGSGGYKAVRYHEVYKEYITPIVKLLKDLRQSKIRF